MAAPPYPQVGRVYDGTHHKTVDGDTFDLIEFRPIRIRLLGVDTPERSAGTPFWNARNYTASFLSSVYSPYRVQTAAKDSFGRELAWVWDSAGRSLNDALLAEGFAEPYAAEAMLQAAAQGERV